MKKILSDTLRLVVITLIAGVLLSAVYSVTKDTIANAVAKELEESYRQVFPEAQSFESCFSEGLSAQCADISGGKTDLNDALYAKDASGNVIGCVLSLTSHEGYGGDIVLSMGIASDGEITGVKVTSMSETSGLGANCQKEEWISQFKGISSQSVKYSKTGKTSPDEIDAISGATYTTKAVTNAVNTGLELSRSQLAKEGE